MADTSIPALKKSFLNAQVRILSAPLEPTEDWRELGGDVSEEGDLDEKTVKTVMGKVNALLKSHNIQAFPAPVLSHVAAQIDSLYWTSSSPTLDPTSLPEGAIPRTADLTLPFIIDTLPEEWPEAEEEEGSDEHTPPIAGQKGKRKRSSGGSKAARKSSTSRVSGLESFAEGTRYRQLRTRLEELREERDAHAKKLGQCRALMEAMRGLEKPDVHVQGNLVTRDGELQKELERMVVLAARVGGKLQGGG